MNEDGSCWHSKLFDKKDGDRSGRYLAPTGNGDQPFLPPVPRETWENIAQKFGVKIHKSDKSFWQWFLTNQNIPVILTEGGKKSLAPFAHSLPAISLYGCQCALVDRSFVKSNFAKYLADRKVYIALDQDENKGANDVYLTVETVKQCKMELGSAITKLNSEVKICSWDTTDEKLGKGLDDCHLFIPEIINTAIKFKAWLKYYLTGEGKSYITESVCKFFKAFFGKNILFDEINEEWFFFNKKCWESLHAGSLRKLFKKILDRFRLPFIDFNWLEKIIKSCSLFFSEKIENNWDNPQLLPFQNGILNLKTGELLPHNSEHKLLFCLPRDYVELPKHFHILEQLEKQCPEFWKWANFATNNHQQKIVKLLAFCNGVLTRKFARLKKFIFIKGRPDTGKSTFLNLLRNMIGLDNSESSNLATLVKDRGNELSRIIDKPLVTFPDEDRQYNGHSTLKVLTGHADGVSYRQNYKLGQTKFFTGTIAIASNYHIFLGDTTGLDQRISFLSLERQVPLEHRDPDLDQKLNNELGSLTSLALALPDDVVTEFIQNRGRGFIADLKSSQWEAKCESDSIAAWLNDNVIFDSNEQTQIGKATETNSQGFLYANYSLWYSENFTNISNKISVAKFRNKIEEICQELGVYCEKNKQAEGIFLKGLTLRRLGLDNAIPDYVDLLKFEENQEIDLDYLSIGDYQRKNADLEKPAVKIENVKPASVKDSAKIADFEGKKEEKKKSGKFSFNFFKKPSPEEINSFEFYSCFKKYFDNKKLNDAELVDFNDYQKHENEMITYLVNHLPSILKKGAKNANEIIKEMFPHTLNAPNFAKYLRTGIELLEYQGFLIKENSDRPRRYLVNPIYMR